MNIYRDLANELLKLNLCPNTGFIPLNNFGKNRWFGLVYRGYEGIMANPRQYKDYVERRKEGYFDVYICTGTRYQERNGYKPVTHYNAFQDLLENSNLENCYAIWRGEFPTKITDNIEEQQALSTLALLMFEQELNWGKECWQRQTNFTPRIEIPYQRPRDMIMGFLKIVFESNNVDAIQDWNTKKLNNVGKIKVTPTFGAGYINLDFKYKTFFEELKNDSTTSPLMIGDTLDKFINKTKLAPDNKFYKGKGTFLERITV